MCLCHGSPKQGVVRDLTIRVTTPELDTQTDDFDRGAYVRFGSKADIRLSISIIKRFEQFDGLPLGNLKTISAIHDAFVKAGIEFMGTPDENLSLRLRTK